MDNKVTLSPVATMNIKKKVLFIVISFFAIIGILFAVLMGIYYYMNYRMQQEIRESMENPNPNLAERSTQG